MLNQWRSEFDKYLEAYCERSFAIFGLLGEAARYSVVGSGKRIRPLFVQSVAQILNLSDRRGLLGIQISIELLHCSTLVHDDLPGMDNDCERRGKPTVHVQYGFPSALMAGNLLLSLSHAALVEHLTDEREYSRTPEGNVLGVLSRLSQATGILHQAIGDVCFGQVLDMEEAVARAEVRMLKTTSLFLAIVRLLSCLDTQRAEVNREIERLAELFGDSFQIRDDLLDLSEDSVRKMRAGGSDQRNARKTSVQEAEVETLKKLLSENEEAILEISHSVSSQCAGDPSGMKELLGSLQL